MRVLRYLDGDHVRYGIDEGDGTVRVCDGSLLDGLVPAREVRDIGTVRLLAPVTPGKIVGVGLNPAGAA